MGNIIKFGSFLKVVFNIKDKLPRNQSPALGRVGVLNSGKNTTIKGCEFANCDIAINNRGEDAVIEDNKIR